MTAKRIALVPYEPGHEPEGMVSDLDPEAVAESGSLIARGLPESRPALAKARAAARRDPWEEWRELLTEREGVMAEALRRISEWGVGGAMDVARDALRKAGAPVDEPTPAEDVPELWVSRDSDGWGDAWDVKPEYSAASGRYHAPGTDGYGGRGFNLPCGVVSALGLSPGDLRRVTREEYDRHFRGSAERFIP